MTEQRKSRIPEVHRELLEKEVKRIELPRDLDYVKRHFHLVREDLNHCNVRLIDALFRQLQSLIDLLEDPDKLTERQLKVAIAAVKYFLLSDDHIDDNHHSVAGLVDDALVVEAAVEELGDLVKF